MSAVIVSFPLSPKKPGGDRLRAVLQSVRDRAQATHATADQRQKARAEAMDALQRGMSVGAAIQAGTACLPAVSLTPYRQPTTPNDPEAA